MKFPSKLAKKITPIMKEIYDYSLKDWKKYSFPKVGVKELSKDEN